jgi:hypothetical protein
MFDPSGAFHTGADCKTSKYTLCLAGLRGTCDECGSKLLSREDYNDTP